MTKITFDFTDRPYIKAHAERTRAEIDWANDPHEFRVESVSAGYVIVNRMGEWVEDRIYTSHTAAEAAVCDMIADDDEDRHLHRHRHEPGEDEPPAERRFGASEGASSAGRR